MSALTSAASFLGQKEKEDVGGIPNFLVTADAHGIAAGGFSIESNEGVLPTIDKFIAVSLIAGVNEIFNIPLSIGAIVSDSIQPNKTEDVIANFDSNLALYYEKHKEGADLTGFIIGSMVPGLGGVKVLHATQAAAKSAITAGKIGKNTQRALGLLAPNKQKWIDRAVNEAKTGNSIFSLTNTNVLAAMGAGLGQNVLEAAAFEVAVAATMTSSPILENQDFGDIMTNIAWGGAAFGLIGGVVDAAKIGFKVKAAKATADKEAMPWTHILVPGEGMPTNQRIAMYAEQLHNIPEVPASMVDRAEYLNNAAGVKRRKLELAIREELGKMTPEDQEIATLFHNAVRQGGRSDQLGAYIGLEDMGRLESVLPTERRLKDIANKQAKGKASIEESTEALERDVAYVRVWGAEEGQVSYTTPLITTLSDTLKTGQSIKVQKNRVIAGSRHWDFDPTKPWDMLDHDMFAAQARKIWIASKTHFDDIAKKLQAGKELDTLPVIHENDISMLEQMYKELGDDARFLVKSGDSTMYYTTHSNYTGKGLFEFIKARKRALAENLQTRSQSGQKFSTPEAALSKLRQLTGLDLKLGVSARSPNARAVFTAANEILINPKAATSETLFQLVKTALHEEGHRKHLLNILQEGGLPSSVAAEVKREMEQLSRKARAAHWKWLDDQLAANPNAMNDQAVVDRYNYLHSEKELFADAFSHASLFPEDLAILAPEFNRLYGNIVRPLPSDVVQSLVNGSRKLSQEEIANMVNVRPGWLTGEILEKEVDDVFALESYAQAYNDKLVAQGLKHADDPVIDIWTLPQTIKLGYNRAGLKGVGDNYITENLVIIKQQQKLYEQGVDRAVAGILGAEHYSKFQPITSEMVKDSANSIGAGPGAFTAASANYGTLASVVENIGNQVTGIISAFQKSTREALEPTLNKLLSNEAAAIEWSTLNANLRNNPVKYTINKDGTGMIPVAFARWEAKEAERAAKRAAREAKRQAKAQATGKPTPPPLKPLKPRDKPKLEVEGAPEFIEIQNPEVAKLVQLHQELNGKRVTAYQELRAAQGTADNAGSDYFYPIPPDRNEYKHFAIVRDKTIAGQAVGHKKTLYARTAEELQAMISKLQGDRFDILTKADAEAYFKAIGQWDKELSLNDNFFNSAMHRKGVSAPLIIPTDPTKIVNDMITWHMQREAGLVREVVKAKYEGPFSELRRLGDQFTNAATSTLSHKSGVKNIADQVANPYQSFITTALGIRKNADYPWWVNTNRLADEAVSKLFNAVHGVREAAKTPEQLAHVNKLLDDAGYKGAHYDIDMEVFANASAPRGVLTSFIQKANAILATVVLRWDHLNAVNNAVSATVLLGAEMKAVLRAIENGDSNAVGQLAKIAKVTVPGTRKDMLAPGKLIAKAMDMFHNDKEFVAWAREHRFVTSISDQYKWTLDNLAVSGKEAVTDLNSKITRVMDALRKAGDKGERWTGNRLAEEFNRVVAAGVMKQITDVAVKNGIMRPSEALSYINTFVNRTQGNYLAAQRPMIFQGPLGQAIGLFQTYQFNLMQQLLRHFGEGHAKDAATLLALQGTIHGMNGLPAFNAINTHIVGNASGNDAHKDAYNATYGLAGKEAGDWLMYGLGSNVLGLIHPDLKTNLYVRGDINPRHVTIIPTNPADVPFVQATSRFIGNILNTVGTIGAGGDVSSALLQGIEHNGISRPLAGLAQVLEAADNPLAQSYSTSKRGNVIAANDFYSLANLIRLTGGKPMDEAIAIDAAFRMKAYSLADAGRRQRLGAAIKSTIIAGRLPTAEQLEGFMEGYVATGGKQEDFNRWMGQLYKSANISQANKLANDLKSKYAVSMQQVMGGEMLGDFEEVIPQ